MRSGFSTLTLAYWIDSLVRVTRRASWSHFGKISRRTLRPKCGFSSGLPLGRGFPIDDSHIQTSFCLLATTKSQRTVIWSPASPVKYSTSYRPALTQHSRNQIIALQLLPSQRFQVFWPSFQSSFHLYFTVLVRYRFPINI